MLVNDLAAAKVQVVEMDDTSLDLRRNFEHVLFLSQVLVNSMPVLSHFIERRHSTESNCKLERNSLLLLQLPHSLFSQPVNFIVFLLLKLSEDVVVVFQAICHLREGYVFADNCNKRYLDSNYF